VTYVVDRQRALNRLRTLPRGDVFEFEIDAMGAATEELWRALSSDDDDWYTSRERLKEAILRFTARVRLEVQRRG
jgi:hypothetical protein